MDFLAKHLPEEIPSAKKSKTNTGDEGAAVKS